MNVKRYTHFDGCQTRSSNRTSDREAETGSCRTGRPAAREPFDAVQRMRFTRMPLQSHAAREAWPLLPGQLHQEGQKQLQVRSQGRSASHPQAVEELRKHEDARGSLDRSGHRTIQPAAQTGSNLSSVENVALSSVVLYGKQGPTGGRKYAGAPRRGQEARCFNI